MVEIRGIGEYKTFSGGSERSRRGQANDGAEFSKLVHAGGDSPTDARPTAPRGEDDGGRPRPGGLESAVYDGSGKLFPAGVQAGRLIDVNF